MRRELVCMAILPLRVSFGVEFPAEIELKMSANDPGLGFCQA